MAVPPKDDSGASVAMIGWSAMPPRVNRDDELWILGGKSGLVHDGAKCYFLRPNPKWRAQLATYPSIPAESQAGCLR